MRVKFWESVTETPVTLFAAVQLYTPELDSSMSQRLSTEIMNSVPLDDLVSFVKFTGVKFPLSSLFQMMVGSGKP